MITVLAANDFGDDLGDGVAGPVGLLIIVLLVIALVFLMRSMNKHLRRVRDDFPDDETLAQIRADGLSSRAGSRSSSARRPAASDDTVTRDVTQRDAVLDDTPADVRGQRDARGR
jgi:hypothetical protein